MRFAGIRITSLLLALVAAIANAANAAVVTFGLGADDYGSLTINGQVICTYDNIWAAGGCTGSIDLESGVWYDITIDYKNRLGSDGLSLCWDQPGDQPNGGYSCAFTNLVSRVNMRTLDASGTYVSGLRGDYYDLGGSLQSTVVGEGPINAINTTYNNQNAGSWNGYGYFSLFEERLTGQIRLTGACHASAIPTPAPGHASNPVHAWSFDYAVSDNDGLVLTNILLVNRAFAEKISVPYFHVTDEHANIIARCELQPNYIATTCQSQLTGFEQFQTNNALIVQADYSIDNLQDFPEACLTISQQYVFEDEFDQACEPTGSFRCARFFPLVKYQVTEANGQTFSGGVNVAERLHFVVDGAAANTTAVFKDKLTKVAALPHLTDNPLPQEFEFAAIRGGRSGEADNFHQTSRTSIQVPQFRCGFKTPCGAAPGCPECVHIHWTWGITARFLGDFGSQFGNGDPLIPSGSIQDVDVAVTLYRPGAEEEHPFDFRQLLNNESLTGGSPVFWYFAQGHQPEDTFFLHGGFFVSRPPM